MKKIILLLSLLVAVVIAPACDTTATVTPLSLRGVNAPGGELDYGKSNTTTPVSGTDYLFISNQDIDYLVAKKITFVRLLFSWEVMQPTLNTALSTGAYATNMKSRVDYLTSKGIKVMIEPHGGSDTNFAKYRGNLIGSTAVPNAAFADFWTRMATVYKDNPNVIFGLMNEPSNMSTAQWFAGAQAAITGIRSTGSKQMIMVPGNGWSNASGWTDNWYDTDTTKVSNATAWLKLKDPANNMVASVHLYLDTDAGGGTDEIVNATVGPDRMKNVLTWAKANNVKVHVSEFGANSANAAAQPAIKNLLDNLEANKDTVIGWAWWAYGPPTWWGSYRFTLDPTNNYATDNVKWTWLAPYLNGTTGSPTPSVTATATATATVSTPTYPAVTYDSNKFFHLTTSKGTYVGYKPDSYSPSTPISLLVWMHGCGGEAEGDLWNIMPKSTSKYMVISIGGRDGACWQVNNDGPMVLAAIADVQKYFNIDTKKIYLSGYSSGGDMTYRIGFENAGMFAGLLVENSDPFRDTGSTSAKLLPAASWKINIVHLAHTSDTTYPIATVKASVATLQAAGFPVTLIEKSGTHWDDDKGTTGTDYDYRTFVLPYLDKGWTSGGGTVIVDAGAPVVDSGVKDAGTITPVVDAGTDSGTSLKTLTSVIRQTYNWDTGYCAEIDLVNSTKSSLSWSYVVIDIFDGKIRDENKDGVWDVWGGKFASRTGQMKVTPATWNKTVAAGGKATIGFCADKGSTKKTVSVISIQ